MDNQTLEVQMYFIVIETGTHVASFAQFMLSINQPVFTLTP